MPTRTTPRPASRPGRFPRTQPHRPAGRRSTPSPRLAVRRKPPKRSRADKALNGLAGLLPGSVLGRKAKPSASGGGGKGRTAGLALLAGAAGLALKKRRSAKTEEPLDHAVAPVAPVPVTPTPVATEPDPLAPAATERPGL